MGTCAATKGGISICPFVEKPDKSCCEICLFDKTAFRGTGKKQKSVKIRHNDTDLFLGVFFNEMVLIYNFFKKHTYGTFTKAIQKVRREHPAQ